MPSSKKKTFLTMGAGFLAGAVVAGGLAGGLAASHQSSDESTSSPAYVAAVADFEVAAQDCAKANSTFHQSLDSATTVSLAEMSLLHTSTLADAVASLTGSGSYVSTCKVPTMSTDPVIIELQTQVMSLTKIALLQQASVLEPLIAPVQEQVNSAQVHAQESALNDAMQAALQAVASVQTAQEAAQAAAVEEAQRAAFCQDNPDSAMAYCQETPGQ